MLFWYKITFYLHPLRRVSAKDVFGRCLSSLEDLHDPQAVEVVNVYQKENTQSMNISGHLQQKHCARQV